MSEWVAWGRHVRRFELKCLCSRDEGITR